jgi:pimeloyl-ACP methyl ester carboxylesterase
MIPGGPADAGVFAVVARLLADRYTVVPYDPGGNSRSVLAGIPGDQDMDVHGDDSARLLEALGDGPAYVFGSSGGAQMGLNLAARHPERVQALVAHEPPCLQLLPDAGEQSANTESVYEIWRKSGAGPAMQRFLAINGLGNPQRPSGPPASRNQEMSDRFASNLDFFFGHGMMPISQYLPEVETLKVGPQKMVVGIGETSKGQVAWRCGVALAERLAREPVVFPGDHRGYGECAAEFAEKLDQVLRV